MNPTLPAEAVAFAAAAARAFGTVDAARTAELDPATRVRIQPALDALGVADLDPRADLDTATAAAELCRSAGRVVLPYPVVGVILARDGHPLALVPEGAFPVDHGDLFPTWRLATVDGTAYPSSSAGPPLRSRLGPFVTHLTPGPPIPDDPGDVRLHLTLTGWQVLGTLERAVELAVEHVTGRIQFGKPIAAFQSVQFQLADAAVAVDGLRELCHYTLWRLFASDDALADALALRLAALDTARAVLRTTQQLHGAAGVCDEYDISILCRHVQPLLRIPSGAEHTASRMAEAVNRSGFEALFPQ